MIVHNFASNANKQFADAAQKLSNKDLVHFVNYVFHISYYCHFLTVLQIFLTILENKINISMNEDQ